MIRRLFPASHTIALCAVLAAFVLSGCQTYAPSNSVRTVPFDHSIKTDAVLEAAIDAARDSGLPPASKIDKANGVVEFGGFGNPELGLSGQVRVRGDSQVEITVKRGSMFVPMKSDAQAEMFKTKLEGRLADLEKRAAN